MNSRFPSRCFPVVCYAPDGGGAGAVSEPAAPVAPPVTPPVSPAVEAEKPDIANIVRQTIADVMGSKRVSGDSSQALEVLAARALKEEQRAKAAEAKIGVIPDEIQAKISAYEALGKADDIKAQLEELSKLQAQNTIRERTDAFRVAATVAGYDADAVLEVIGEVPATQVEKQTRDGKESASASVRVLDAEGKESLKPFEAFMTERFARVHQSLKASAAAKIPAPVMGVNGAARNSDEDARRSQSQLYGGSHF